MAHGSKGGRNGRKLLWLALLLGVFCGFESHYQILRLVELTITPPGSLPDQVLWRSIGSFSRRFWLIPLVRRESIARELEERFPADIAVSVSGWGLISIAVKPHIPWIEISYQGKEYTLSSSGYIWPKTLSIPETGDPAKKAPLPLWVWGKGLQGPFSDSNRKDAVVQRSALPLEDLHKWQENLTRQKWLGRPIYAVVSTRGGERFLKIVAQRNEQRIQLELDDQTDGWETVFSAARQILGEQERSEAKIVVIDATYEGKIVARNVVPQGTDSKPGRPEGSESK